MQNIGKNNTTFVPLFQKGVFRIMPKPKNNFKDQERDGKGRFGSSKVKSMKAVSRLNAQDFDAAKGKLKSIKSIKQL